MSSFIRESKIRHITVTTLSKDHHYEQLKLSTIQTDSNLVTANNKFISYPDSGGNGTAIAVLPLESTGKNHVPVLAASYQQPLIRAHSQPVQDLIFNPFHSNQLYSCAGDGYFKVWSIPEGGYICDTSEAVNSYSPVDNCPLRGLSPHLSVDGIVACRGIKEVLLMDVEANNCIKRVGGFSGELQSMCWSNSGDVLCTTSKKCLDLVDIRGESISATVNAHGSPKSSRVQWLGDSPYLITCGFSNTLDREMLLWDSRHINEPVQRYRIDSSTGPLMPHFDSDHNFLVLMGKGDTTVRVYDFDSTKSGELIPVCNSQISDGLTPTRGMAVFPKQVNDLWGCEILRMLRLTEDAAQPISFSVPRRERCKFHDDLFPPTTSLAPPVLTTEEWLSGATAPPGRVPLAPPANAANVVSANTPVDDDDDAEDESDRSRPSSTIINKRSSFGSNLKFRHMYGKEWTKDQTWYNLQPAIGSNDGPLLASSDTFWAMPWRGAGGAVFVSRLDRPEKADNVSPSVFSGHRGAVLSLAFSPFHEDLLATASEDSHVKVWRVPEDGKVDGIDGNDALADYAGHTNSVRCCNFHPRTENMIATASLDSTVRLWDINSGADVCRVDMDLPEGGTIGNLDFNYSGYQILAACKDKVIRVVDPRHAGVVQSTPTSQLGRNLRAIWCNSPTDSAIVATFIGSSGRRQIQTWDSRNLAQPTSTQSIDSASGTLFPMYDEDTGLCIVAGKGDTIVRHFELTFLGTQHTFSKSGEYQSSVSDPIAGVCLLPKKLCDFRSVEVNRILKLTDSTCVPVSFYLPRAESLKSYFQDDIYPPTRARRASSTITEWVEGSEDNLPPPELESLQPPDMEMLSNKPAEQKSKPRASIFREEINKKEEENRKREESFARLQDMAILRAKYHPNASGADKTADDDDSDDGWDD
mmetsp:Transcript_818/g.1377  ORF Transcript_818/g.1377 Transcript_818/m.1377 type:complete len:923 (-) Transcript_818:153-2921(-)|eukprot:CAMPEP_0185028130 /NCGR_PEP_ID=MMETSP1103-20130426/13670_1 /TAXON_ID=36769 /ORGANISM="Paraphysomonas bandaiensis, Strain Caron Lab Isolate" /LENGTH=922 /DNA_ID=CAMNT_0027562429 /DNA_START=19 /DNA_END=2787 /DNA_ORIENTATION=-